jgi:hypothetical protein
MKTLTSLALLGYAVSADKAGASVGIDHEFVEYVTSVLGPEIVTLINGLAIPAYSWGTSTWDSGYVKNAKLALDQGDASAFSLEFDADKKALALDVKDVTGKVNADFQYCQFYLCVTASLELDIIKAGVSIAGDLDLEAIKADNGNLVPQMTIENFLVALPEDAVKITLGGSIVGKLANQVIPYIKS